MTAIPHDVVDALIAGDRASAADAGTHVLYVLNPAPKAYASPTRGARAYAYAYDSAVGRPPGQSSTGASGCVGQLGGRFKRPDGFKRLYAWFDLTRVDVDGPSDGGEGATHAFPRVHAAHRDDRTSCRRCRGVERRAANTPRPAAAVAPKVSGRRR